MDGNKMISIQVKSLSKRSPVSLGKDLSKIMGHFWIIINNATSESPNAYIMEPDEVIKRAHRGEKEGRVSYWLEPKAYAVEEFYEKWERIV